MIKNINFNINIIITIFYCIIILFVGCIDNNRIIKEDNGFIRIKGGIYRIGSSKKEYGYNIKEEIEKIRNVEINDFYIFQFEVTQKLYFEIMGKNNSSIIGDYYPVDNVTWYEAIEFCNALSIRDKLQPVYEIHKDTLDSNNRNVYDKYRFLVIWNREANGYRLPTSDEWEIACRAGSRTQFNTGKTINKEQANFRSSYQDENTQIKPVGSYNSNKFGLYDMHGNVREWCWEMLNGMGRIIRGGAWDDQSYNLRSGRVSINRSDGKGVGFRIVRNAD